MWKRFWLCSILFFLLSNLSIAQGQKIELIKRVGLAASFIESNNMGKAFVTQGGVIKCIDLSGNLLDENSTLAMGEITSLDASNSLKMVLYFKDLSQIVYLDNQLAQRGENVALDVLGLNQITAVCRSYNDGLWVYDQTTFNLIRLNEYLTVDVESGNLGQILGFVPEPTYMREFNNWLYVNDPQHGIFVFDRFGSYSKTISVIGVEKFVIRANRLFFVKDGKLQYYHLETREFAELNKKQIEFKDFTIYEDKLLLITQNELLIYRLNVK